MYWRMSRLVLIGVWGGISSSPSLLPIDFGDAWAKCCSTSLPDVSPQGACTLAKRGCAMAMADVAPRCSCIVGRRNEGGSASDGWRIEKRKQESVETCRHFFPSSPCDTHLHGTLFLWSGESLMHMSSLAETAIGVWGLALDLRLTAESFPLYLSPALTPALGLPCRRVRGNALATFWCLRNL